MPLVQVDMSRAMYGKHAKAMSDELQKACVEELAAPANDKFQVFVRGKRASWCSIRPMAMSIVRTSF